MNILPIIDPAFKLFWFRRDLRIEGNSGLYQALKGPDPVLCMFIFDTEILNQLNNKGDERVNFIYQRLVKLKKELEQSGSSLLVLHGKPELLFSQLIQHYQIREVIANHDYEPYALRRDGVVERMLQSKGIHWRSFKDQLVFEKDEVAKEQGGAYTVFTPYSKAWLKKFRLMPPEICKPDISRLLKTEPMPLPSLEDMGFQPSGTVYSDPEIREDIILDYHETRDVPSLEGTSRLGVHLRFGTIDIRVLALLASRLNPVFLNELIWREFFMTILFHFPHVAESSFRKEYDRIPWNNDTGDFERWCTGTTGFPIVDAGMRQLLETGWMHNRVRMITASFLTKHLLIDWRWGEAWFAEKLIDYELSSNNGNWQWAAGTGCDAAPYFRIFNPLTQQQRYDPHFVYVKKWVREYGTPSYPNPIVDPGFARERCLKAYKAALNP